MESSARRNVNTQKYQITNFCRFNRNSLGWSSMPNIDGSLSHWNDYQSSWKNEISTQSGEASGGREINSHFRRKPKKYWEHSRDWNYFKLINKILQSSLDTMIIPIDCLMHASIKNKFKFEDVFLSSQFLNFLQLSFIIIIRKEKVNPF